MSANSLLSIVDPHLHLFDLQAGEYAWLKPENAPFWPDKSLICRNFDVNSLWLTHKLRFSGCVHIEAGYSNSHPEQELTYLNKHFDKYEQLKVGLIAYADITLPPKVFQKQLLQLASAARFKGLRYIFDDKAKELAENQAVFLNLSLLAKQQYIFELQFEVGCANAIGPVLKLLQALPELKVVLNHVGFAPSHKKTPFLEWQDNIAKLACIENLHIKCSGFEMGNRHYTNEQIRKVIAHCLIHFGQKRLMCASNFPLTLFSCSYQMYWQNIRMAVASMQTSNTPSLMEDLCANNAVNFYQLVKHDH